MDKSRSLGNGDLKPAQLDSGSELFFFSSSLKKAKGGSAGRVGGLWGGGVGLNKVKFSRSPL